MHIPVLVEFFFTLGYVFSFQADLLAPVADKRQHMIHQELDLLRQGSMSVKGLLFADVLRHSSEELQELYEFHLEIPIPLRDIVADGHLAQAPALPDHLRVHAQLSLNAKQLLCIVEVEGLGLFLSGSSICTGLSWARDCFCTGHRPPGCRVCEGASPPTLTRQSLASGLRTRSA